MFVDIEVRLAGSKLRVGVFELANHLVITPMALR